MNEKSKSCGESAIKFKQPIPPQKQFKKMRNLSKKNNIKCRGGDKTIDKRVQTEKKIEMITQKSKRQRNFTEQHFENLIFFFDCRRLGLKKLGGGGKEEEEIRTDKDEDR